MPAAAKPKPRPQSDFEDLIKLMMDSGKDLNLNRAQAVDTLDKLLQKEIDNAPKGSPERKNAEQAKQDFDLHYGKAKRPEATTFSNDFIGFFEGLGFAIKIREKFGTGEFRNLHKASKNKELQGKLQKVAGTAPKPTPTPAELAAKKKAEQAKNTVIRQPSQILADRRARAAAKAGKAAQAKPTVSANPKSPTPTVVQGIPIDEKNPTATEVLQGIPVDEKNPTASTQDDVVTAVVADDSLNPSVSPSPDNPTPDVVEPTEKPVIETVSAPGLNPGNPTLDTPQPDITEDLIIQDPLSSSNPEPAPPSYDDTIKNPDKYKSPTVEPKPSNGPPPPSYKEATKDEYIAENVRAPHVLKRESKLKSSTRGVRSDAATQAVVTGTQTGVQSTNTLDQDNGNPALGSGSGSGMGISARSDMAVTPTHSNSQAMAQRLRSTDQPRAVAGMKPKVFSEPSGKAWQVAEELVRDVKTFEHDITEGLDDLAHDVERDLGLNPSI